MVASVCVGVTLTQAWARVSAGGNTGVDGWDNGLWPGVRRSCRVCDREVSSRRVRDSVISYILHEWLLPWNWFQLHVDDTL